MLPPNTPPYAQQYVPPQQQSRGHPGPPSYPREPAASAASHRPTSSMSISSMLGNDADKPREAPFPRSNVHTNPSTVSSPAMPIQASAGPSQTYSGPVNHRTQTPESARSWHEQTRPARSYSGGLPPQRPYSGIEANSESRFGPPIQTGGLQQRPLREEPEHSHHARRTSIGNGQTPARSILRTPPAEQERRIHYQQAQEPRPFGRLPPEETKPVINERRFARSEEEPSFRQYIPKEAPPPQHGERHASAYPFLARQNQQNSPYTSRSATAHGPLPEQRQKPPAPLQQYSSEKRYNDPRSNIAETPQEVRRTSLGTSGPQEQHRNSLTSVPMRQTNSSGPGDRLDRTSDSPSQQHKTLLGLFADSKRGGRLSPLPQAVQGAQARSKGPASEPGIKSEFARMFSGIGSGVGSNMSTPQPQEAFPPPPAQSQEPEKDQLNGRTPVPGLSVKKKQKRSRRWGGDQAGASQMGEDVRRVIDEHGAPNSGRSRSRQSYNSPAPPHSEE
jgi:hypothetical protein